MKVLIKYLKLSGIFYGLIAFLSFLLALLNLLGVSHKITSIISIISMVLLFLILGLIEGLNTSKKGFIAGFKLGLYLLLLLLLSNLIFFHNIFSFSRLIYYLIILFCSIFGAMIGINRKKKE